MQISLGDLCLIFFSYICANDKEKQKNVNFVILTPILIFYS